MLPTSDFEFRGDTHGDCRPTATLVTRGATEFDEAHAVHSRFDTGDCHPRPCWSLTASEDTQMTAAAGHAGPLVCVVPGSSDPGLHVEFDGIDFPHMTTYASGGWPPIPLLDGNGVLGVVYV